MTREEGTRNFADPLPKSFLEDSKRKALLKGPGPVYVPVIKAFFKANTPEIFLTSKLQEP